MTIKVSDLHEFSNTVNNSIININSWFISNLLTFNIDKSNFLQKKKKRKRKKGKERKKQANYLINFLSE